MSQDGGSREVNEGEGFRGRVVDEGQKNRGEEEKEGEGSESEMSISGRVGENNLQKNCVEVIMCKGKEKHQEKKGKMELFEVELREEVIFQKIGEGTKNRARKVGSNGTEVV